MHSTQTCDRSFIVLLLLFFRPLSFCKVKKQSKMDDLGDWLNAWRELRADSLIAKGGTSRHRHPVSIAITEEVGKSLTTLLRHYDPIVFVGYSFWRKLAILFTCEPHALPSIYISRRRSHKPSLFTVRSLCRAPMTAAQAQDLGSRGQLEQGAYHLIPPTNKKPENAVGGRIVVTTDTLDKATKRTKAGRHLVEKIYKDLSGYFIFAFIQSLVLNNQCDVMWYLTKYFDVTLDLPLASGKYAIVVRPLRIAASMGYCQMLRILLRLQGLEAGNCRPTRLVFAELMDFRPTSTMSVDSRHFFRQHIEFRPIFEKRVSTKTKQTLS